MRRSSPRVELRYARQTEATIAAIAIVRSTRGQGCRRCLRSESGGNPLTSFEPTWRARGSSPQSMAWLSSVAPPWLIRAGRKTTRRLARRPSRRASSDHLAPRRSELNLSRRARRRPRSQRGNGTGSRIESRNTSWSAAKSSRLGRSSVSKNSCHGGLDGLVVVSCGGGADAGRCFLSLILRTPFRVVTEPNCL
jgi:hypothetical protein